MKWILDQIHGRNTEKMRLTAKKEKDSIDLVFIDGRFRVACCLKCYKNCVIAFDDFLNREYYFDIVEKTVDNRMVILTTRRSY